MINTSSILQNWRIIILRPQRDPLLEEWIQLQGGLSVHFPMFTIAPLEIAADVLQAWQAVVKQSSFLLIASQHAVHAAPIALLKTITNSRNLKIITMGKSTSLAANEAGLSVFYTPPPGTTSETLLQEPFLQQSVLLGKTVVLLAGTDGRTLLAEMLAARGASVQWCKVYRQAKIPHTIEPLLNTWCRSNQNVFIVTSLNILVNLLDMISKTQKAWFLRQGFIVASERIAQYANKFGAQHVFNAKGADLDSIAQALQEMCKSCNTAK